eukprot:gnl/TRDRNA2_/TRDRNA2_168927_c0_seq1.p1 gnl/TRDRNA2_/TRDRNA2_168927_c0~~gnl/TRDRNA2_/TRDRNA2_168927_c0_seq1.p1  ORF type:complete len:100 (-),score=3.07 gnl/TRDRNA2_/TRDRNA2_168927_c0_seq1:29-328(-)
MTCTESNTYFVAPLNALQTTHMYTLVKRELPQQVATVGKDMVVDCAATSAFRCEPVGTPKHFIQLMALRSYTEALGCITKHGSILFVLTQRPDFHKLSQ